MLYNLLLYYFLGYSTFIKLLPKSFGFNPLICFFALVKIASLKLNVTAKFEVNLECVVTSIWCDCILNFMDYPLLNACCHAKNGKIMLY